MQRVLLITTDATHRKLYERGLEALFRVALRPDSRESKEGIDAIIYDLPSLQQSVDLRWLQEVSVPVVVLTCEDSLRIPANPLRRVLTYPVRMDAIVRALVELGVRPRDGASEEGPSGAGPSGEGGGSPAA